MERPPPLCCTCLSGESLCSGFLVAALCPIVKAWPERWPWLTIGIFESAKGMPLWQYAVEKQGGNSTESLLEAGNRIFSSEAFHQEAEKLFEYADYNKSGRIIPERLDIMFAEFGISFPSSVFMPRYESFHILDVFRDIFGDQFVISHSQWLAFIKYVYAMVLSFSVEKEGVPLDVISILSIRTNGDTLFADSTALTGVDKERLSSDLNLFSTSLTAR